MREGRGGGCGVRYGCWDCWYYGGNRWIGALIFWTVTVGVTREREKVEDEAVV